MYFLLGEPKSLSHLDRLNTNFKRVERSNVLVAVIDDEQFQYLELLRDHHFNLRAFKDIEDVKAVEAYQIVLCDIKGVGRSFKSKFEGAHVISEIKKHYPDKTVIAYTGQTFNPTYNKYLSLCDDVVEKDIDSGEWVDTLDEAIKKTVDPIFQWKRLRSYLIDQHVPLFIVMQLEDEYVNAITNRGEKFPSNKTLSRLNPDIRNIITGFAGNVLFKLIVG